MACPSWALCLPEVGSWSSNLDQVHGPTLLRSALLAGAAVPAAVAGATGIGAALQSRPRAVVVAVFSLQDQGIAEVGAVLAGLPVPQLPRASLSDISDLLPPALGVAIAGYTDNVLTARVFGARHGQQVDANQEWFALGSAAPPDTPRCRHRRRPHTWTCRRGPARTP